MSWSMTSLAKHVGGETRGLEDFEVQGLHPIDDTRSDGISPLFRKRHLHRTRPLPGAVLCAETLAETALAAGVKSVLVHRHPVVAFAAMIDLFYPESKEPAGIHPSAVVHAAARIHPSVVIGPRAVVESGVVIGENSIVGPGAILCEGAILGCRVRIGPGAVIGYEGFGFIPSSDTPIKIRQVGCVVIEDDVEIGANTCIDRGTLGATVIGAGSKIDNLVQVGHNARIGRGVLIAGQAGLAGSVTVGDGVLIGGNAGIADHVTIGSSARIAAKSGVVGDIPAGATVAGYPAMERLRWLRSMAVVAGREKKSKK